jgi:hypothetical protein
MLDKLHDDALDFAFNVRQIPDDEIRQAIQRIEAMPKEQRFDAFDLLETFVQNNHPYGRAAPIFNEIEQAANKNAITR